MFVLVPAASAALLLRMRLLLVLLSLMRLLVLLILMRLLVRLILMRIFTRFIFPRLIRTRLIFMRFIRTRLIFTLVVCPLVIRPLFRTRILAVRRLSVSRRRCMAEIARSCRRRVCRPPVIHGSELRPVLRSRMLMLHLRRSCLDVTIVLRRHFFLRRTRVDTAPPAVEAHVTRVIHYYGPVIRVVNDVHVHVAVSAVVSEHAVVPIAALVAYAHVPEAIVNPAVEKAKFTPAVETDVRSPIPRMPRVQAPAPSPVTGCPQETNLRRHHPGAWYPVVVVPIPGPIARCPNVPVARADRLRIHRQGRRTYSYRDAHPDLSLRVCWHTQHCKSENQCKEQ